MGTPTPFTSSSSIQPSSIKEQLVNETSTHNPSDHLLSGLHFTIHYARALLGDVSEEQFDRMPMPGFNHPAFCYGHLACYPNRMLDLMQLSDSKLEIPFDEEPYLQTSQCVEEEGRYAPMPVIVEAFFDGHQRLVELLPTVPAEVFASPTGFEGKFGEMFPRVGDAVTFMCGNHTMLHLGQVSMWRRAMGLGSCM